MVYKVNPGLVDLTIIALLYSKLFLFTKITDKAGFNRNLLLISSYFTPMAYVSIPKTNKEINKALKLLETVILDGVITSLQKSNNILRGNQQ